LHEGKPKFGRFETWGACSRCGARVRYNTLARERLTGLLVCTISSGRPVKPCLDPWPPVYDFQVTPDRSIEPPPEPLPARWGLDTIWSANKYVLAPSDAARLESYMKPATSNRDSASFASYRSSLDQNQDRATLQFIRPQDYDGTFIPSNSVRTVATPEPEPVQGQWTPPWAVVKGM
jgi:hypothetical protein